MWELGMSSQPCLGVPVYAASVVGRSVRTLSWCSRLRLVLYVLKAVHLLMAGNSRGGNSKQGFILQQLCFQNKEIWKGSWQWSSLSPGFDEII